MENIYLWSVMKKSSVSRMQRFMYSQILCYILEIWIRFKDSSQYRTLDTIDGEPMEFEWNIFPGFTTLQLVQEVQKFMNKMSEPEQFQGRIIFMSMFNDIIWWIPDKEKECIANSTLVSLFARWFPAGRWSFLGLGSETKWYSTYNEGPQGEWDRVAELMMIKFRESGHPVFRATSPLSRGTLKSQGGGKLSFHWCADRKRLKLFFCTIISVNQLSIYGAVSVVCDEYSTCQTSTERDPYWQSNLTQLFAPAKLLIMTPTPSIEILAQENLLQKYKEREERLPQQDQLTRNVGFEGIPKLDPC